MSSKIYKDGITIFTPVYNRSYCIDRVYQSLLKQNYHDFEWIIIDDGSSDDIFFKVDSFMRENIISVTYVKCKNGGKMRAHNKAVSIANYCVFFTLDSDDMLEMDALRSVWEWFSKIQYDNQYAGVVGLRKNSKVNRNFDFEYIDINNSERRRYGLDIDVAECYKTALLMDFLLPEYENERYLDPGILSNSLGNAGYILRFYNHVIYLFEFQGDGLTKSGDAKFFQNPRGWALQIKTNIISKRDDDYTEFAYYRFLKFAVVEGGIEKKAEILGIDDITKDRIINNVPNVIKVINELCKNRNYKRVALYGMGQEGTRFLKYRSEYEFEIVYGIDKEAKCCEIPCGGLGEKNWKDEVDAIFITNKYFINEIRAEIESVTSVPVLALQNDIWCKPWNYYFCSF